jgi:hypothetical protein
MASPEQACPTLKVSFSETSGVTFDAGGLIAKIGATRIGCHASVNGVVVA